MLFGNEPTSRNLPSSLRLNVARQGLHLLDLFGNSRQTNAFVICLVILESDGAEIRKARRPFVRPLPKGRWRRTRMRIGVMPFQPIAACQMNLFDDQRIDL